MVMLTENALHEGDVVIAGAQTNGRGQRGNVWEAAPGQNLTFSLVLAPHFLALSQQFFLNVVASLAVADAAAKWSSLEMAVKWPNDIYCGNQKIGGILIENTLVGRQIKYSIVGIGLNVNQSHFASPQAASLLTLTGQLNSLPHLLNDLMTSLDHHYGKLVNGEFSSLKADYLQRLYGCGQWRTFTDLRPGAGQPFVGRIENVAEDGRLVVKIQNAQVELFYFKEIGFC